MSIDFLKNSSHFTEDGKGNYYKKTDNFLFTVASGDDGIFLFINLPELDDNQRKASTLFIKENVDSLTKVRIVKSGIKMTLTENATEDAILSAIEVTSDHFTKTGIAFPDKHYDVVFKNHMYVFEENGTINNEPAITENATEEVATEADVIGEDAPIKETDGQKKSNSKFYSFIDKTSSQVLLIAVYTICSIAFFLLSLIHVSLAAVTGYFMGWLATAVLVRKGHGNTKIFILVTVISLFALIFSGFYSFLFQFLIQQDIYTAFEFFYQSLSPLHCIFNILLGVLLSLFGTYSTLPAKKKAKKPELEEDF